MLLAQRQQELEQRLLATVSMTEKETIVLELSHMRDSLEKLEND